MSIIYRPQADLTLLTNPKINLDDDILTDELMIVLHGDERLTPDDIVSLEPLTES